MGSNTPGVLLHGRHCRRHDGRVVIAHDDPVAGLWYVIHEHLGLSFSGVYACSLSTVFHNYGDVFSGQAARLSSFAFSLANISARSARVNVH
jgi:hypothetical protein